MRLKSLPLYVLIILIILTSCSQDKNSTKVDLTISAAASLSDVLSEMKVEFEKDHKNIDLNFNFAGSGTLQQQIIQGAPVDLFFSAAEKPFQKLIEQGLIDKENQKSLLGNRLVLITPKGRENDINTLEDLLKADKIAVGTPESVPVGQYTKESLQSLNLWDSLKEHLVMAKDVRQVLTYVETGNVEAGIVYQTDAKTSDKVVGKVEIDPTLHSPITYPVGVISQSENRNEIQKFFDYLMTNDAKILFEKYGFIVLD